MVKNFCKKAELSLEQQLAEAKQEVIDTKRRTEDYIHEAKIMLENAEARTKQMVWEKVQPHLIEVLGSEEPSPNLTEDQRFFHRRLIQIKNALEDLGIPH
jgi:hypothetical protein